MATPSRPLRRGQIWWVNWEPHRGSEQAGRRPALVIQSNVANEVDAYGLAIVAAMTTSDQDRESVLHVAVEPSTANGLSKAGFVKCEQVMTIHKSRLDGFIGMLEPRYQKQVDNGLKLILDLGD